ncbi:MAG: GTP-binding protein [Bacteriovoracaceae bacterium]|nr:GTP-binding protein [Bacteriovoracaceae bacterium]
MADYSKIKNIAIVAHVDHGKTTLVDGLLRQSGVFTEQEEVVDRVMDSGELERERGITISAKNCAIFWKGVKINLLDTPGHADFGGEVERSLMMVDSVLLLVDASEGPLPQTRFVLTKAMEKNLKIAVVINKVDRPDQRIDEVKTEIEDLFLDIVSMLNIEDFDFNIPIIYASAKEGWALHELEDPKEKGENLLPILDFFVSDFFTEPKISSGNNLQVLVSNLSYSPYLGPLMIGRIQRGSLKRLEQIAWCGKDGITKIFKVTSVQVFGGLGREEVESCSAGEIVIISGLDGAQIGDSICSMEDIDPLPRVDIEPPTVSVNVSVSTSPISGQEGDYLTSRKLKEFLEESCRLNVALKYEDTDDPKIFTLKGRGELQLAIVFEELRRKGFEFMVSRPKVIMIRNKKGQKEEPYEMLSLDVPNQCTGVVTKKLSERKGRMESINTVGEDRSRIEFTIPSRSLIGYRSTFLTDTRGEGLMSSYLLGHKPFAGKMLARQNGALIADRRGKTTPYALFNLLSVGAQFVKPGEIVYEGMVVGEHKKTNDSNVNPIKEKHLSSMRTAGKDENIVLPTVRPRTLEWALSWIDDDEWVEVTPKNIRIRKKTLPQNQRSVIRTSRNAE